MTDLPTPAPASEPVSVSEPASTPGPAPAPHAASRWRRLHRHHRKVTYPFAGLVTLWLLLAYLILPIAWSLFGPGHPALADAPRITLTKNGIHGDPVNIAIVAFEEDLQVLLSDAGWLPSDPRTLRSCLKIARCSIFHTPYETAPVSDLYLWGCPQNFAFQLPVGKDPRRRHHVRFWRSDRVDDEGRPLWLGAATYDTRAGLSSTTLQITHHVDPDVDAEREKLLHDLTETDLVDSVYWIRGFHEKLEGRNGGGDRYRTDGDLPLVTVKRIIAP